MAETSAIVLAGVHQWGESGFDELLPRPLMPVAHTPLVCHILAWLRSAGIAHATICTNSASRQLRRVVGDAAEIGIDVDYCEDWMPRGPAGCIRDASALGNGERTIVIDGTILPECDLDALLRAHLASGAAMTVVAACDAGVSNGNGQRLAPVGVYVLERAVLEHIPETGYQDIKEVLLPRLHERGVRVQIHTLPSPCPRLTDAESYLALNAWALERLGCGGRVGAGYRQIGQSIVHQSIRLPSPDVLQGRVLVGPGTVIARGAMLVGPTALGAECVIEPGALVCDSVLWNGCRVGRGAAVNHCILGDAVEVKPEAILFRATLAPELGWGGLLSGAVRLDSLLFPVTPGGDGQHGARRVEAGQTAERPVRLSAKASA